MNRPPCLYSEALGCSLLWAPQSSTLSFIEHLLYARLCTVFLFIPETTRKIAVMGTHTSQVKPLRYREVRAFSKVTWLLNSRVGFKPVVSEPRVETELPPLGVLRRHH